VPSARWIRDDDRFVVGYGLDLDGRHRNLPDVAIPTPMTSREQSLEVWADS
jgi:hypothetical protein